MKKIVKEVNDNIVQITIADERWYIKETQTSAGLETNYVPSVTWIASHYPKGIAYFKWLADKGWDEAESLKQEAGDKGSKVHYAIEDLVNGKTVKMDDKYINPTTEEEEELTLEEYECLMSFSGWFNAVKPKVIETEVTVFNDEYNYAGTIDLICEINRELWIIDYKTSQSVWPSYEIQVSAYKQAIPKYSRAKLGILQLGYRRNKNNYKFNEIEDKFELFLAARQIWENESSKIVPKKKDYPMELKLDIEG